MNHFQPSCNVWQEAIETLRFAFVKVLFSSYKIVELCRDEGKEKSFKEENNKENRKSTKNK